MLSAFPIFQSNFDSNLECGRLPTTKAYFTAIASHSESLCQQPSYGGMLLAPFIGCQEDPAF